MEYAKPLDFRIDPYEVGTVVAAVGNRSFTLAAEIRDPTVATVFATARTVVVGESPLSSDQRSVLERWAAAPGPTGRSCPEPGGQSSSPS
jgi:acyl-CoA thioester hydrolase